MTDQQLLIHHRKVMIEEHLSQSITVKDVCNKYRVSRTTFYKWFGRYLNAGESGLFNKVRSNGAVERLHQTINQDFYQVRFRKTIYQSLQQLQDDLDVYIDHYNFQRPNQGIRTKGKVPGELYLLHNYFFN